ncbi:hypothetical protein [Agromyces silvae]|uniref:hypothetical protein n=1 Tax=Agromyces silvae TaxID=3388266 RepID=UPI00280BE984|nr:hypothetical protein [Agromyces protaetiae]
MQSTRGVASAFVLVVSGCLGLLAPAAAHAAHAASDWGPDTEPVVAWRATSLPPLQDHQAVWLPIDSFTCPGEHPWLLDRRLSQREDLPRGVDVDRGRSVIVAIGGEPTIDEATGYVTGWGEGVSRAANFHPTDPSYATVRAVCTSDPDLAYTGTP